MGCRDVAVRSIVAAPHPTQTVECERTVGCRDVAVRSTVGPRLQNVREQWDARM